MAELIAIRHGHSERQQLSKIVCPVARQKIVRKPDHDADLSTTGTGQAKILAQYMFNYGGFLYGNAPDSFLVSPYLRARKTADALHWKDYSLEALLRERSLGLLEHIDPKLRRTFHAEALDRLWADQFYGTFPSGESVADTRDRVKIVLDRALPNHDRTLIVCHNRVMWGMRALIEELDPDWMVDNMDNPGGQSIENVAVLHYTSDLPDGTPVQGTPSGAGYGLFKYYSLTAPAHMDSNDWPEARVWHHL